MCLWQTQPSMFQKVHINLLYPPKRSIPRAHYHKSAMNRRRRKSGRQEQGAELSEFSHVSWDAPSKVSKPHLTTNLWMLQPPGPWAGASWPFDPAPLQRTRGESWFLSPSNAQTSSTAPLGREEIVSKVNCFLDCFLSRCEGFSLGDIMGRGDTGRWRPCIPEPAAGARYINKPIPCGWGKSPEQPLLLWKPIVFCWRGGDRKTYFLPK